MNFNLVVKVNIYSVSSFGEEFEILEHQVAPQNVRH